MILHLHERKFYNYIKISPLEKLNPLKLYVGQWISCAIIEAEGTALNFCFKFSGSFLIL